MKIKIIDLLNKIYNNDNIPKRIIYRNCGWEYNEVYNDFIDEYGNYLLGLYIHDYDDLYEFLNSELEITETSKKIEKLEKNFTREDNIDEMTKSDWQVSIISKKINEIIDIVNKLVEDNEH